MNARQRLELIGRPPTDAEWIAISERRPIAGQRWLLVVTSTGIVCKPGCPARTPGRDRVRIVSGLAEGLAAGARPCLRCRPDRDQVEAPGAAAVAPGSTATGMTDENLVARAVARLSAALESDGVVPLDRDLATELAVPERRLREAFREKLGVTPRAWVAARRAETLRGHLSNGHDVLGALFEAGYGSSSAG